MPEEEKTQTYVKEAQKKWRSAKKKKHPRSVNTSTQVTMRVEYTKNEEEKRKRKNNDNKKQ